MTSAGLPPSRDEARATKAQVAEHLADQTGVVGVGLERTPDGGWCVRVNVTTEEDAQAVGTQLQSASPTVPVQVRVTGTISATGDQQEG